ncbi:MAG: ABC transporter substrate-binding protein [Ginsengibacter sp.]
MKRSSLLSILTLLLICLTFQNCSKSDTPGQGIKTVNVPALLSLTGNWSTLGITSKAALELGVKDVNAYMTQIGSKYRFTTTVYDTKLDTALAKQFIVEAKNSGANYVIGPQSSAEVGGIKQFADANNIIVVSQGSTAGSLSIAGDNIFRFCPDDKIEGAAMANTIYKAGVKSLVTVSRDDAGNKGLQSSVESAFSNFGGTVGSIAPYASTTSDFTSIISDIKSKLQAYIALNGTTGTAVYLASFDECVQLFKQAANDPVLSSVNWYGGDGVVLSAALLSDSTAARFAANTNFFAPTFGLPTHGASKWQPLATAIKSTTNIEPDAFALAAYDALWVIALTYNATTGSETDFEKLKSFFPQQANIFYGVTGPTLLNDAGDRAIGSFDYWGITSQNNSYGWTLTGKSD